MKMLLLIFSLLTMSNICCAQTFCLNDFELPKTKMTKISKRNKINIVLDSLKTQIVLDTLKFNSKDLYISSNDRQTKNEKDYSALYVVQGYSYKLDIINGKLVREFIDEMLISSKIKKIYIVDKTDAQSVFGQKNGMVYIVLKKDAKTNFNVAGLKITEKNKTMNNFWQLKNDKVSFD
ncbi:hypothetical protein [Flavobacterium sp. UBA7663]|uniref:hypothetical protein n=1 Tax=Flavobacterium sp. UBA7663 TaxID=1946557 RepID=UPI0025C15949|nr:hypothetical protein [Flavobacterium sp. UBA7663]